MRILLDTNALLWAMNKSDFLPPRWRQQILNSDNDLWVSSISLAEIAIKVSIGKLPWQSYWSLEDLARLLRARDLPFVSHHAVRLRSLPLHHRDPFDRMLIAQAQVEDLAVMTTDRQFAAYGVKLVPAA